MNRTALISIILFMVFATQSLASCGSNGDDPAPVKPGSVTVNVSPENLVADAAASELSLSVTADADWSISTNAQWVSVRPSGGLKNETTVVRVSVSKNAELSERKASLQIKSRGENVKTIELVQYPEYDAKVSASSLTFGGQKSSASITVSSNTEWSILSSAGWIAVSPSKGEAGETDVTVKVEANETQSTREGALVLKCGDKSTEIKVAQLSDEIVVPEGYTMVWNDEFNECTVPGSDWVHENWAAGHVNNELQTYTGKEIDGKRTLEVKDGFLHINCFKGSDGKIYSGRINARPSEGWLYGYVEARICLPEGKGTWPAFWMMPSNVDWNTNPWPYCGEIDIMEEVGADPNQVSSSLHTGNYNHTKNTQKTHAMNCPGAEGEFHIYALEWTADEITTYVDGKVQLKVTKSQMGTDHADWPFHYAFYPILNLAWGGDWGGYKGVDESALPVTMKVDYVRIFQKQ